MFVDIESQQIDASVLNAEAIFDVRHALTGSYQIEIQQGAISSAVLTLWRSNDRVNWQAESPAVTASAAGFYPTTGGYDVTETSYHKWEVTTANGAALTLSIAPSFQGDAP
jgi:hypothetical protein